jgi:hypothetical protein
MQSNTTISPKVYLLAILDNYTFRPLLAIFRLSSRELNVLLYTLCTHVVQRSLHTGLIAKCNFYMWWYALSRRTVGSAASVKFEGSCCAGIMKRRVPLHNTSETRTFVLHTSHQTLSCL